MSKICTLLSMLLCFASTMQFAYATDPLKEHEAGFGPKISGLQLGKPMTWPEMVNMQTNIHKPTPKPWVPGTPPPVHAPNLTAFGMFMADSDKGVDQHNDSPSKPGNWLLVNFVSVHNPMIMNGGGDILSKVPTSGTIDDLFAILKKNGLHYASTPNLKLYNERLIEYSLNKDALPTEAATVADLAQWVKVTCALEKMEQKGEHYEATSESEGWRVVVKDDTVTVSMIPIPATPQ